MEIGPKDVAKNAMTLVKRNDGKKSEVKVKEMGKVKKMLDDIQREMYEESTRNLNSNIRNVKTMGELKKSLGKGGFSRANWCGSSECEDCIKDETGANIRGTLYGKTEKTFGKCVYCGKGAKSVVYIARAY